MSFISNLFGGGGSQSSSGGYQQGGNTGSYVPLDLQGQNQNWLNVLSQIQNNNVPAQLYPQIASTAQGVVNNPYAAPAQTAANSAGQSSTNVGGMDLTNAGNLSSTGNALLPYATQILDMGLDPQSALYNRTLGQVTDQINAQNAASGIGTSPAGAGITDQALSNFNIDWQNNALNRANTAAGAASTINQAGGSDITQAGNIGNAGVTAQNAGGQLPYAQYGTNLGNILTALNAQSAAGLNTNTVPQGVLNALQSYMGLGQTAYANSNNAANTNFTNTLTAANAAGNAASAIPSLSSLQSLFGSSTPSPAAYIASSPASQVATDVASTEGGGSSFLDAITSLFG